VRCDGLGGCVGDTLGDDLVVIDILAARRFGFDGRNGLRQEVGAGFEDQSGIFLGRGHRLGLSWG
jgi:hypothetical protein